MTAWNQDLVAVLNRVTRECMFDWDKVSAKLQDYAVSIGRDLEVNPAICREQFAAANTVQLPQSVTVTQASKKSTVEDLESLSLEELIDHVEKTELDMIKRKEEIFQRVLTSLGGKNEEATFYQDATTSAYHLALAQKDEIKRLQELRIFEAQERERLDKERELLKKRFEPDSQDAVGEFPELNTSVDSNHNDDDVPDIDGAMLEHILGGYEFDVILSELEKELDSQAVGKDDGEISELGEILNFLESEAKAKKNMVSTNKSPEEVTQSFLASFDMFAAKASSAHEVVLPPLPPAPVKSETKQIQQPQRGSALSATAPRSNASANSGRGGRGRAEYAMESDGEEDGEEEDDDENWRKRRNNIKKSVEPSSLEAPSKQPGFWGAFGENAQDLTNKVPRELKEAAEIVLEIARTQAAVASEDSDDSFVEEEEEEEKTAAVVPMVEEKVVEEEEVAEADIVEEDTAVTPAFEEKEEVVVQKVVAAPVQPAIVVTPVAEVVDTPPVEVASASSGSLLAQAGSRRNKAAKGPIMSAAGKSSKKTSSSIDEVKIEDIAPPSVVYETPVVTPPVVIEVKEVEAVVEEVVVEKVVDPLEVLEREKLEVAPLVAPRLSLFPWTSVVDKSKGIKIVNAHDSQTSVEHNVELSDLVLFSIDTASVCSGDLLWFVLLEAIVRKLSEEMTLAAFWRAHPIGANSYQLVFQAKQPGSSPSLTHWNQWLNSTDVKSVVGETDFLSSFPESLLQRKFSELIKCVDYFTDAQCLLHAIEQGNVEAASNIALSAAEEHRELNVKMLRSVDFHASTTCVLKDHLLLDMHIQQNIVSNLVYQAESAGLRVLGAKLVFINSKDRMQLKKFTTCDVHTTSRSNPESMLLPLICIAFASSKSTLNSADVIRNILGPEDPVLARKTDPSSLRARFGIDRDCNLAYATPFSKDKLYSELKFWFGSRTANTAVSAAPGLSVSGARKFVLSLKVHRLNEEVSSVDSSVLLRLQSTALKVVLDKMQQISVLDSIDTLPVANFTTATFGVTDGWARKYDVVNAGTAVQCFVISFLTLAADNHMDRVWAELTASLDVFQHYQCSLALQQASMDFSPFNSTAMQNQIGSKYAALQALKKIPFSDYKSHEDVGLSDCIVLQFVDNEFAPVSSIERLTSLISMLPATCNAHILGVKSVYDLEGTNAVFRTRNVWVIVRGYQLIESIDHAIQELQRSVSASAKVKLSQLETLDITYVKGKKASELIFSEFSLDALYLDLPFRDLQEYVPCSHEFISTDISGKQSLESIAHALFPPGNFQALAAVVVPWTDSIGTPGKHQSLNHSSTVYTRNISRIISRLEKEHFQIVSVFAVKSVADSIISALYKENVEEYLHTSSQEEPSWSSYHNEDGQLPATIILVMRKSALLKIKSIVGPIFNDEIALLQYPRSLSALLASLSPGAPAINSLKPDEVATNKLPVIIPTMTCKSVDQLIKKCAPEHLTLIQQLQSIKSQDEYQGKKVSEAEEEVVTSEAIWDIVEKFMESDIGLERRVQGKSAKLIVQPKLSLSTDTASSIQAKTSNIAGLVITHALIKQHGLGLILEAIHREGLWVTNALTTKLNANTAKLLLEAAGASSLTMKPTKEQMLEGPVVCLGLCGPMHSFVRLKSFTTSAKSSTSIWMLNATDFGALASSSSSLAKDLYCLCFDSILGNDSPFEVVGLDEKDSK